MRRIAWLYTAGFLAGAGAIGYSCSFVPLKCGGSWGTCEQYDLENHMCIGYSIQDGVETSGQCSRGMGLTSDLQAPLDGQDSTGGGLLDLSTLPSPTGCNAGTPAVLMELDRQQLGLKLAAWNDKVLVVSKKSLDMAFRHVLTMYEYSTVKKSFTISSQFPEQLFDGTYPVTSLAFSDKKIVVTTTLAAYVFQEMVDGNWERVQTISSEGGAFITSAITDPGIIVLGRNDRKVTAYKIGATPPTCETLQPSTEHNGFGEALAGLPGRVFIGAAGDAVAGGYGGIYHYKRTLCSDMGTTDLGLDPALRKDAVLFGKQIAMAEGSLLAAAPAQDVTPGVQFVPFWGFNAQTLTAAANAPSFPVVGTPSTKDKPESLAAVGKLAVVGLEGVNYNRAMIFGLNGGNWQLLSNLGNGGGTDLGVGQWTSFGRTVAAAWDGTRYRIYVGAPDGGPSFGGFVAAYSCEP